MLDTKKILDALQQNTAASSAFGGFAGSLLGNVLGGRRKGGGLLQTGALAAVAYLAYQTWQRHQAQQAGQAPPAAAPLPRTTGLAALPASVPDAFDLTTPAHSQSGLQVVRAMIAASKADGVLEPAERDRIFSRVNELQLSQEEHDYVLQLLSQPPDVEQLVRGVGSKEVALELYTASALAVHPASRAERAYLDMLAARLGLEESLVREADRTVEAALVSA